MTVWQHNTVGFYAHKKNQRLLFSASDIDLLKPWLKPLNVINRFPRFPRGALITMLLKANKTEKKRLYILPEVC